MDGNKLSRFASLVIEDAKQECDKQLSEISIEKSRAANEYRESMNERYKRRLERELDKIRKNSNENFAERQMDYKKRLLIEREKLIDALFVNIADRLREFTKTEQYEKIMKKSIEGVAVNGCVIIAAADDAAVRSIAEKLNMDFAAAEADIIGGCTVVDKAAGVRYDLTYATKLQQARSDFLGKFPAASNI